MTFPLFPRLRRPVTATPAPTETASVLPDRAEALGDDVEAFLGGDLVEHLVSERQPVPAWAVLNKLAHATVQELADLAGPDGDPASDERAPCWKRSQRSLAAELLEGATTDGLAEIQRTVLVPLELWMIDRSRSETITSRRVIQTATEVLDDLRPDR